MKRTKMLDRYKPCISIISSFFPGNTIFVTSFSHCLLSLVKKIECSVLTVEPSPSVFYTNTSAQFIREIP